MKSITKHHKLSHRVLSIITAVIIVLLLLLSGLAWFLMRKQPQPTSSQTHPSTKQEKNQADVRSSSETHAIPNKYKDTSPQNTNPTTTPETYNITLTDISSSQSVVTLRAVVDSPQNGQCSAVYTRSGATTVQQENASRGSDGPKFCHISIPRERFTSSGEWQVEVKFVSENHSSTTSKTIQIE